MYARQSLLVKIGMPIVIAKDVYNVGVVRHNAKPKNVTHEFRKPLSEEIKSHKIVFGNLSNLKWCNF